MGSLKKVRTKPRPKVTRSLSKLTLAKQRSLTCSPRKIQLVMLTSRRVTISSAREISCTMSMACKRRKTQFSNVILTKLRKRKHAPNKSRTCPILSQRRWTPACTWLLACTSLRGQLASSKMMSRQLKISNNPCLRSKPVRDSQTR